MKKFASTAAILVVLWVLRFGFNVVTAGDEFSPDSDDNSWIAEENAWIDEEVVGGSAQPARGWLAGSGHGTFEADPEQLDALVEKFHAGGAGKVWMVGIEEFGGAELSDTIAVELPADPGARARLFAIESDLREGYGTPDVGQRYLTVSFD